MLSFTALAGTTTIQVLPVPSVWMTGGHTDLLMQVDVLSSTATLATRTGAGIASFTINLATAGTYYVSVTGAGNGNPATPPGFSNYGSRGQYKLTVSYPAGSPVGMFCTTPTRHKRSTLQAWLDPMSIRGMWPKIEGVHSIGVPPP